MKAGHSKLDGYRATLPAMRPSPRLPTVVAPLPPPPSSLVCAHTVASAGCLQAILNGRAIPNLTLGGVRMPLTGNGISQADSRCKRYF